MKKNNFISGFLGVLLFAILSCRSPNIGEQPSKGPHGCILQHVEPETSKEPTEIVIENFSTMKAIDYYAGGMKYKIFAYSGGGMFVINITKDSLETIKLIYSLPKP